MTVSVIAKLTANDGQRDDLVAALQPMLRHVEENEPDTVRYILMEDTSDENVVWLYEEYVDQAAFEAHGRSDTMKALGAAIGPFMGGAPELIFCRPVAGKGL